MPIHTLPHTDVTVHILFISSDTPPGTSDEHLTVMKALKNVKPDGAVIVTTPQKLALGTIRKEINFCRKMGLNILGILGIALSYTSNQTNVKFK
jgi:MinD superfamily P-loop ATPase